MEKRFMHSKASGPVLLAIAAVVTIGPPAAAQARYPIVYSTDLYYTIADIDDHFDAAVLLKSPELDIKGVILDNHLYPCLLYTSAAQAVGIFSKESAAVLPGIMLLYLSLIHI